MPTTVFTLYNSQIDTVNEWGGKEPYFGIVVQEEDRGAVIRPYYKQEIAIDIEGNAPVPALVYLQWPNTHSTARNYGHVQNGSAIPFMVRPGRNYSMTLFGLFNDPVQLWENVSETLQTFPQLKYTIEGSEA